MRVCKEWFPNKNPDRAGFFMEEVLARQIELLAKNVVDDWDFTIVITGSGEVRVGKSLLAMQVGCYWTYLMEKLHGVKIPFNTKENICLQWEKLIEQGNTLGQKYRHCVLIYDEAGETMEGTKAASSELKAVRDYLRECGQYNFLNILVLPEFFDLPKGIALTRATLLLDVYYSADKEGKFVRGYFRFYSRKNKKHLYLKGKKTLNYFAHPFNFEGRFHKFYPIDEQEYRSLKIEALKNRESMRKDSMKYIVGATLYLLGKELEWTQKKMREEIYKISGEILAKTTCGRLLEPFQIRHGPLKPKSPPV